MTLLDEVKRALEPIAKVANAYDETDANNWGVVQISDFRRARSALAALEAAGGDDVVEKVARAIYEAHPRRWTYYVPPTPWGQASSEEHAARRVEARAALAALGVK